MENLIIVSNRLPVKIERKVNGYDFRQSSGGLVSALLSLCETSKALTWVGIADFKKELWNEAKTQKNFCWHLEPLFVNKQTYQSYYNGFSNTVIWPLFHYFPSYAEYSEIHYEAYKSINKEFADRIIKLAKPGSTVWIHDYHLMLLPKYLKQARPDLKVGFFLHIPFPSYEILKLIPGEWRTGILEGLIHSDTLGFHTLEYLSHFKRSLAYFVGISANNNQIQINDHTCKVKNYPISVDFKKFHNGYDLTGVIRGRNIMRQKSKNVKIIFSVDRLDYTKGVINRLQAYESFLESNPAYREKVVFVINVVPSRDQIAKYAERKKMIEENIGRINGLFGNMQWQPIVYQYRHLSFNQLLSFYSVADIALITPLRDGMNLVAKEFVASRKDKRGVLILSEFAGAASELKDAILVNPNDIYTMRDGIQKALHLTDEQQTARMESMQNIINNYSVHHWIEDFLSDLAATVASCRDPHIISFEEKINLFDAYKRSEKRLLLLDYDGTLSPYYSKPDDAKPKPELLKLLKELNGQPENEVVLVSGRSIISLDQWFGGSGICCVAEHGAMVKNNEESWIPHDKLSTDWYLGVEELFLKYAGLFPGCFVERKKYAIAFHYRGGQVSEEKKMLASLNHDLNLLNLDNNYRIIHGNKVLEALPLHISKGIFVSDWLEKNDHDFILAIGDDSTDEDMFRELALVPHAHTIRVGIVPTQAKCNLINVSNVLSLLSQLNECRSLKNLELTR
jgi:trehalose 6-phosphate synthase/phosphatase